MLVAGQDVDRRRRRLRRPSVGFGLPVDAGEELRGSAETEPPRCGEPGAAPVVGRRDHGHAGRH